MSLTLIQHYVDNFRRLPWRSPPGKRPPIPVAFGSAKSCSSNDVAAVRPRFERFVRAGERGFLAA
jgi:A/G-specific adenine glycosylase